MILDGKKTSEKILKQLAEKVKTLDRTPTLAVILVGNDPASEIYVKNKEKAAKLALIGSIREDILPNTDLVAYLLNNLKEHYPLSLLNRFGIDEIGPQLDVCEAIARKRGLLKGNGEIDHAKAESLLLKEFKDGLLGRITLEWL